MSETLLTTKAPPSRRKLIWHQFRRHKLALFGLIVLTILIFVAFFSESIAPYDPNAIDAAYAGGKPQPPSLEHVFGTDNYGRDYFSRAIFGMRISLVVGVTAVIFQLVIGVTIGATAGYFGGGIDNFLMRITDIFLSIPSFFVLLILAGVFEGTLLSLIFAIGVLSWMTVARLVRAEFLSLRQREFIEAARCVGVPGWRLATRHLLPNALAPIIVAATLSVPYAVLTESALSFLSLGVPPPNASLGNMLEDAQKWLRTAWWIWVVPGVLISLIVLTFNFVGDGLRDALDPKLQR